MSEDERAVAKKIETGFIFLDGIAVLYNLKRATKVHKALFVDEHSALSEQSVKGKWLVFVMT